MQTWNVEVEFEESTRNFTVDAENSAIAMQKAKTLLIDENHNLDDIVSMLVGERRAVWF